MSLLTVIIPIYNCAPVIRQCLDSIDYPDAEVLVIDDGSTDSTAETVLRFAQDHPNVRLIQKENGGVSSARNLGLASASGKYVLFIDADDYLVPGGISRIVELAENNDADVVTYRIVSVSNTAPVDTESVRDYQMAYRMIIGEGESLLRYDVPDYHVVDAVFRRLLINENEIRFSSQLSLREDDVFCGMLFCHANKVIVTDLPLYRYVRSSNYSSTHNQSLEKQRKLIASSYLAMRLRGDYVKEHCPEAMPWERMKYMRWVCHPKTAFNACYSLSEYKAILNEYKELGCWPLEYNWIHAAGLDETWKQRMKNRVKTFLCNHPGVAYQLLKLINL